MGLRENRGLKAVEEALDLEMVIADTKEVMLAGDADIAAKSADWTANDQAGQAGLGVCLLLLIDLIEPGSVAPARLRGVALAVFDCLHVRPLTSSLLFCRAAEKLDFLHPVF